MLSKKKTKLIFVEAFILTLVIYLIAIISNGYLDNQRIEALDYELLNTTNSVYSLDISNNFVENFNIKNCTIQRNNIFSNYKSIKKLGTDLSNYGPLFLEENSKESELKQREYFLQQIKIFNIVNSYNQVCNNETIFPIIYFYNSFSTDLDKQSLILEQFYLNHENKTIVFSFDINFENESIINETKNLFSVKTTPFLILNNKTTRELLNENSVVNLNTITVEYKKFKGEI